MSGPVGAESHVYLSDHVHRSNVVYLRGVPDALATAPAHSSSFPALHLVASR